MTLWSLDKPLSFDDLALKGGDFRNTRTRMTGALHERWEKKTQLCIFDDCILDKLGEYIWLHVCLFICARSMVGFCSCYAHRFPYLSPPLTSQGKWYMFFSFSSFLTWKITFQFPELLLPGKWHFRFRNFRCLKNDTIDSQTCLTWETALKFIQLSKNLQKPGNAYRWYSWASVYAVAFGRSTYATNWHAHTN